jgi:hypothetical protein
MNKLLATLFASAFAFSVSAMAQTAAQQDNSMLPLSKMDTEQAKAARAAAKAKWDAMTPEQQAAAKKAARSKRLGDANAIDMIANDNMQYNPPTKAEQAASKSVPKPTKAERAADVKQSTKPTTGQ